MQWSDPVPGTAVNKKITNHSICPGLRGPLGHGNFKAQTAKVLSKPVQVHHPARFLDTSNF